MERQDEGGNKPTLTSVLRLMISACSCIAFLCMAYKMFSSITAGAMSLGVFAVAAAADEEDVLGRCPPFLRFGMTVRMSWRALLERLRTSTSQEKGCPTCTVLGAVKVIETPKSVSQGPCSRDWLAPLPGLFDGSAEMGWLGTLVAGAGVLERLLGRLGRCIDWPGAPKVGLSAVEKSTVVFHRIWMVGWQLEEARTVAWTFMRRVRAEVVGVESLGWREKRKTGLSFGRQVRGSVGVWVLPTWSVEPSDSCMSISVILMDSWEKGAVSISRTAITEGPRLRLFDFEYRTRLEIAGNALKAFCAFIVKLVSLAAPSYDWGAMLESLDAGSHGTFPRNVGSPLRDSSRLIEPGTPLGKILSLGLSLFSSFVGCREAEGLKTIMGDWSRILGRHNGIVLLQITST